MTKEKTANGKSVENIRSKGVKITLDKERTLKFDLNGFAELEELYGSIDNAFAEMQKGKLKAVRAVLWAGLIHEDEELTQKDVGRLISIDELSRIGDELGRAMKQAAPVMKKKPQAKKESKIAGKN